MSEDPTKQLPETDSQKLTLILAGVQELTDRVESAESIRPLLHTVVDDISQLREGQIELRTDVLKLEEGQRTFSTEVRSLRRDMENQFSDLHGRLSRIQLDHCDIHDRVTRLELNSTPPNTQT